MNLMFLITNIFKLIQSLDIQHCFPHTTDQHLKITTASIIAKVVRDQEMEELDKLHPQFGFAKHKGYPTKVHFEAIEQHGEDSQALLSENKEPDDGFLR